MRFNFNDDFNDEETYTIDEVVEVIDTAIEQYHAMFSKLGYTKFREGFVYGLVQIKTIIKLNSED